MKVLPFKKLEVKPEEPPYATGEALCIQCKREWIAVAPVGVVQLQCPDCLTMKGLFRFPFSFKEGQLVAKCPCGNKLFYLSPVGHMCANCGDYRSYD